MKAKILRGYQIFRQFFFSAYNKKKIIDFKKNIWQTEEVSQAFIKGSDADLVSLADVMDREVNVFFHENCNVSDNVLDIGCGHGIVSEFLASRGINVTSVDISEELLDEFKIRIKGKNLPIKIIKGDAYNIPLDNQTFDKVVARMFLPHFPDWPIILKEMARVTKIGGKLLVHFSSKENRQLGKNLGLMDCKFSSTSDTKDPWTFYAETNTKEIEKAADRAGLKLLARTPVSFFAHNRIIGYQLGQELYDLYQKELGEKLKDEKVREFVIWFDRFFISKAIPALSHFNILTFKKES